MASFGGLSLFHMSEYEAGVIEQNERSLDKFLEGIEISVAAVMSSGNAELAHAMAEAIRTIPEITDFRILRIDGTEAFRDNQTIDKVNRRLNETKFALRKEEHELRVLKQDDALIVQALRTLKMASREESGAAGAKFYTQLLPIAALESCGKCHNSRHPVRGFIKMTSALVVVEESVRKMRLITLVILMAAIASIAVLAWLVIGQQKRHLRAELAAFRNRLHQEIAEARLLQHQLQEQLLPSTAVLEALRKNHGLVIKGHVETAENIGGDLWGVIPVDATHVAVFAADFSGHGVSAARNTVRLQTLLRETTELRADPSVLLTALNQHLMAILPRGQFATMFYGVINTSTDTLLYAGCGFPPALLAMQGTEGVVPLPSKGVPLGIKSDMVYLNKVAPFPPGAILLIHSDGMTDSGHKEGLQLEEAVISGLLAQSAAQGEGLEQFLARLEPRLKRPLDDDLTAVWVARGPRIAPLDFL